MNDDAWISDYVLGEGSADERADAERRLAADPLLAERARELAHVIGLLGELPGEVWRESAVAPAEVAGAGGSRPRSLVAVAAAVVLFAAGLGAGAAIWAGSGSGSGASGVRTSAQVTLRPLASAAGVAAARGRATLTSDGRLHLRVSGLPDTGRGRFYEAWLMTSTTRLVPLGSFRVTGGRADIRVVAPAALTAYRYIDVSLQSTAAGPEISGTSVLRGATG